MIYSYTDFYSTAQDQNMTPIDETNKAASVGGRFRNIRSSPGYRPTLLVVDDQPTIQKIHEAILKSACAGARIVCMGDALAAIEWMRQKNLDLIVMDYWTGNFNSIQFITEVRRSGRDAMPPIVVVTAQDDAGTRLQLLKAGASACLAKPASIFDLSTLACRLLGKHIHQRGLS